MALGDLVLSYLPRPIRDRIGGSFGRRLARGAFWTLVGTSAARLLRFPVSIVLARLMGPAEYGHLGVAVASIDLFGVFAGLGLGMTTTKYVAELRSNDPSRAGRIVVVSTIVAIVGGTVAAIVLFVLAPWLAAHALAEPQLTAPLRIGTLALVLSSINGVQAGTLYGFEAFRVTAQLQAIVGALDLPCMLGGYFIGGLDGILYGMACSRFANWLLMRHALKAELRRHAIPLIFRNWKQELGILWRFSVPAALGGIMVIPVNWICSAILVNQPRGYAEMGGYNAANQWYNSLLFLPCALGSALLPVLADRMGNRDSDSSKQILSLMMKMNFAILLPCAICLSVFSQQIMRIYGHGYRDAWPTMIAVVWTAVIMGVIMPVGEAITASGRMWLGLMMNTGWAVIYVASTVLLIHWGSLGLASSRLIAYVIHGIWVSVFAYHVIGCYSTRPALTNTPFATAAPTRLRLSDDSSGQADTSRTPHPTAY